MNHHLKLLGFKVRDIVTGYEGIVASIAFDLYGCVQAYLTPIAKGGKIEEGRWFDNKRLQAVGKKPVMAVPTFEVVPGGQELPLRPEGPR